MAAAGVVLRAGAGRAQVFGEVVVVGVGGVVAEAVADVTVALGALSADGVGGVAVAGRAALGAVLARLGALLAANPGVEEIEMNPLRITGEGLVALDAVLRTADDCA